jgi:hypothetical protein
MHCKHGTYVGSPHGADHMCGYCEDGVEPETQYTLHYGVHGASRVSVREYETLDEAKAKGLRWSQSNSIGSYWAQVRDENGQTVAQYN